MSETAGDLVLSARGILRRAESQGRELTGAERVEFEGLLDQAANRKSAEQVRREVDDFSRQLGHGRKGFESSSAGGLGDQFIESKGYKDLINRGLGSGTFSTGPIELETKGTLMTTPGTALTPAGYVPGIVQTLYQRPYLAD